MKPAKTKRHKYRKKVLKALLLAAVVLLVLVCVLLYNPVMTLASLEKADDFPLYVMRYRGEYFFDFFAERGVEWGLYQKVYESVNPAACTSFAALNPEGDAIFGRNFDWQHRSSLLLFTDPPGGYASVSMVDLYYLGLEGMQQIPWSKRINLLGSPYATIDGMNECGVAISQNAVPARQVPYDPNKPTLLQSQVLRLVLDHARDVDEALTLIKNYNVRFLLPNHFHIADASGNSAVVEYVDGKIVTVRADNPWQVSTNFLISEEVTPDCPRYNRACQTLGKAEGSLSEGQAISLLKATKLDHTVWSVVYNLSTGRIHLAMGKNYDKVHTFELKMKNQRLDTAGAPQLPVHMGVVLLPAGSI